MSLFNLCHYFSQFVLIFFFFFLGGVVTAFVIVLLPWLTNLIVSYNIWKIINSLVLIIFLF